MKIFYTCIIWIFFNSCNYISYTPKTKRQQFLHQPSVVLLSGIVDFRIEQMGWPTSRTDFISKGKKYYDAFENFEYLVTDFRIKDSNNMIFYFSRLLKDVERENDTKKSDLNAYGGHVKFYKQEGKFLWKVKMN
jgi:hypothetical protein